MARVEGRLYLVNAQEFGSLGSYSVTLRLSKPRLSIVKRSLRLFRIESTMISFITFAFMPRPSQPYHQNSLS